MEEQDPMAEFLAREQAILGADAALFGNPITANNNEIPLNFAEIDQLVPIQNNQDLMGEAVQEPMGVFVDSLGSAADPIQNITQPLNNGFLEEPVAIFQQEEKSQALM
jgi:hypothetical protein